jgi:hypothetical protein
MSKAEANLSASLLHELLSLDEQTGRLFWKERLERHFSNGRLHSAAHRCANWNSQHAGEEAFFTIDLHGYRHGYIFGQLFSAARVIYAMANGRWPDHHVDHINGVTHDDRPVNLRDVPRRENMRNRAVSSNSKTGAHGVSLRLGKYDAYITVDGRKKNLGRFDTLTEAVSARKAAEAEFGYHLNHGRTRHENHA